MNGDFSDKLAIAFKGASDAAFSLQTAFQDNGDEANAAKAADANEKLFQAATDANAAGASQKLSDTAEHQKVLQQVTDTINAAAAKISADEATVQKWVRVATNAVQLVAKAGTGNIGGAIGNAQSIVQALS